MTITVKRKNDVRKTIPFQDVEKWDAFLYDGKVYIDTGECYPFDIVKGETSDEEFYDEQVQLVDLEILWTLRS